MRSSYNASPRWYQRCFAWMMAHAAGEYEAAMTARKQALFDGLEGTVLELGPGAGPNLCYYSPSIQWIGLEPNPFMLPYLQTSAAQADLNIQVRQQTLEQASLPPHSVDVVVSTLVLCSVPNLSATLEIIHRILKPGGRFLFIEHVAAPSGSLLRTLQSGIRPIWQIIGDGCQLNRDTGPAIKAAGFDQVEYETFDGPVPIPLVGPHICGTAIK
ncbi:class I SAM-dependent methyltransferase [Lyngbya confervoides]|uniref:Class I SAM-dependent methyltransferase n=1 Tax=Lyngbya confervoides BDU141951 TaxID=1574623 RepID=A0ABD4SY24_9CYAN|nr:class I SAM-dependent methyltransferase [Lyngbya confervoides]MCM1981303.1 class I SAM-dependent methyltransferase [Lyngbya confervoides BDU141951]